MLRIGFLILWQNQTLAKQFCGQIGDFIDVNADEKVLRLSLPILTSLFYCTFLFRTKQKAAEFLVMAKAFEDVGGSRIKAMGIDEIKSRPKLVSILFSFTLLLLFSQKVNRNYQLFPKYFSLCFLSPCIQAIYIIG